MPERPDPGDDLEKRKLQIEIELMRHNRDKAQLEVYEMRHWWRRPAYVQALLAVLVTGIAAFGSLLLAYANGWFDAQRIRLESQRELIKRDIADLQAGKDTLSQEIKAQSQNIGKLQSDKNSLEDQIQKQTAQLSGLQKRIYEANWRLGEETRFSAFQAYKQKELEQEVIRRVLHLRESLQSLKARGIQTDNLLTDLNELEKNAGWTGSRTFHFQGSDGSKSTIVEER
jgi:Skp family chaperone for outer membrane proteins